MKRYGNIEVTDTGKFLVFLKVIISYMNQGKSNMTKDGSETANYTSID